MKKSLSFLVALALVFGLFASMAAAADTDLTTAQKYQQLVDNKVLKGTTDGDPHLTSNLTRAEFATIAVAIAGLQEDTTSTSAFSDVKAGQWWTGAIQAAYNAGLVNGVGNGLFSPKANVTVQEIVKVAVGIAGLTPVADAKVDGAADWAGPYIKAAQDAGLPVPTNYTAAATRGQTIDLAYAVYLSKQVKPLSDVTAVANSDDTITVKGKTAGGVDGVKVAIGTADAVAATLNADGTFTYTTAAQAAGSYDLTVTAYKGTTSVTSTKVSVAIDGFSVQDVKVLNAKQIAITFNKAVQSGTAIGGHKYGIVNATDASQNSNAYYTLAINGSIYPKDASLSDDQMTVTLTFNDFSSLLGTYVQLSVSGSLKAASGKSLTSYKQAVQLSDSTAPTATGISYSGYTATVTLSEPVKKSQFDSSNTKITLNGTVLTAGTSASTAVVYEAVTDSQGDVTSVKIYNLTPDTSYSLYIVGMTDLAGNIGDYSTTFTLPSDNTAPAVASVTANGTKITIKYSKALAGKFGSIIPTSPSDISTTAYRVTATSANYDSDNLTVTYDVKNWLTGASYKNVSFKLENQSYTDLVGNFGGVYSTNVTIGLDTTKPTVSSAQYAYDGVGNQYVIAVKFDESLSGLGNGNVTLKYTNSSSVVKSATFTLASVGATVGFDANNNGVKTDSGEDNYVIIPVKNLGFLGNPTTLGNGTYALSLGDSAVLDTASTTGAAANLGNNSGSVSFTVSSSTASGTVKLSSVTQSSNGVLKFIFNSNLTTADLDVSKFLINGTALPTGTNLYFLGNAGNNLSDTQVVIAELPEGAIAASGTRTVKVVNIVDENGNTLNTDDSSYYQANVNLLENVKPVAQSVAITSDKQIAVTFSETLDSSVNNPTGITVSVNGNTVSIPTNGYTYANNVLYINASSSTFTSTQSISVTFSGATVKDLAGNTAKDITVNK